MRTNRRGRGVTTVEAAVVLPLMIMLTFAMIEYGWIFLCAQQTTNAARHGARVAVTADANTVGVLYEISGMMGKAGLGNSGYTCSILPSNVEQVPPGDAVTVELTVPCEAITITGIPLPLPENLHASVSMAKEGP